MKRYVYIGVIALVVVAIGGCQAVFTYSPLTFLQRDAANLSAPQKIQNARDILVSGTDAQISAAYNSIVEIIEAGDTSPETNLLAADLAFTASGIMDIVSDVLENPDIISTATTDELTAIFESLDTDLIAQGASFVQTASATDGAEISNTQYIIAGASLLLSAAEEAGSFDIFSTPPVSGDPGYDEYQEAATFLNAAGIDELASLFDFTLP